MVRLAVALVVLVGMLGVLPAAPAQAQAGTIYYVSTSGNDANSGTGSWATAKRNLQSALAIATDSAQIWVAAGTYYPGEGITPPPTATAPRTATLTARSLHPHRALCGALRYPLMSSIAPFVVCEARASVATCPRLPPSPAA